MDPGRQRDPAAGEAATTFERISDRELIIRRTVDAGSHLVFDAWTKPELFQRWWAPKSLGVSLISYEANIRTGGDYRLVMGHPSLAQPMAFFGRYIEVSPPSRLVWTNEEGGEGGAVTTVTFEETDGRTDVVVSELYFSKDELDDAVTSGSASGWGEQFEQLEELAVLLKANA